MRDCRCGLVNTKFKMHLSLCDYLCSLNPFKMHLSLCDYLCSLNPFKMDQSLSDVLLQVPVLMFFILALFLG